MLGDVIVAVGSTPVSQNEDLLCAVEEAPPNSLIELTVARRGDPSRLELIQVRPVARKEMSNNAAGLWGGSQGYQAPLTGVRDPRRR